MITYCVICRERGVSFTRKAPLITLLSQLCDG
jgi:hypothetical protein